MDTPDHLKGSEKGLADQARDIFLATLSSIEIGRASKKRMRRDGSMLFLDSEEIDLAAYKEVVLIGFGKASLPMGSVVEEILGNYFSKGILVTDRRHEVKVKSKIIVAGHPIPDSKSLLAGDLIISTVRASDESVLFLFLISGGGSALIESPVSPDIKLEDLQKLNGALVGCGANINEINKVRKRLSRIKGGRLGQLARKSRSVAIFISDVNPGDFYSLASNPLFPEEDDGDEVDSIIKKYHLEPELPRAIRDALHRVRVEKVSDRWVWKERGLSALTLLDNHAALRAARQIAESAGYNVELDLDNSEGHYQAVVEGQINRVFELQDLFPGKPVCLISGGEVSCPVKGDGLGGRNHEFVLYSATRLAATNRKSAVTVLSCGTDGIDGNSNSAGAVAGADLIRTVINQGVDITSYFNRSDSHSFFRQFGGVVYTGPTGNNVRDIRILLSNPVSP
jgi:glycerate-2-kinase